MSLLQHITFFFEALIFFSAISGGDTLGATRRFTANKIVAFIAYAL